MTRVPDAACEGASTIPGRGSPFYPDGSEFRGEEYELQSLAIVRTYCLRCPSRAECEDEHRKFPNQSGIWAGLTERQRREMGTTPSCQVCGRAVDPVFPSTRCRRCRDESPARDKV